MQSQQIKNIYTKACGKVLIAGGYGVLQQFNIGLSLALQNYFYCKLQHLSSSSSNLIIIESPQIHKKYHYSFDIQTLKLKQKNSQQNLFVQNALFYSLQYFKLLPNTGHLKFTLIFDKGFISQSSIQNNSQKFINYSQNYSKTGLGSSACVIVSIVSAISALMNQKQNKNLINVISQVANLSAQKKIGSNFDISTAVFGTHLYKNVLPQLAFKCIQNPDLNSLLLIDPQIKHFKSLNKIIKNQTIAYLIDVSKGANTRVMVSNFLRNLRNQSKQIQEQFFTQSQNITQRLYEIIENQEMNFSKICNYLKDINNVHRKLQQKYSKITKTAVEPEQYEQFMNELMNEQGVLYLICPGSGGYDALFMLALNNKDDDYYKKLLDRISQKYGYRLGEGVKLSLKRVYIKWDQGMQVIKQEQNKIEQYLNVKNLQ